MAIRVQRACVCAKLLSVQSVSVSSSSVNASNLSLSRWRRSRPSTVGTDSSTDHLLVYQAFEVRETARISLGMAQIARSSFELFWGVSAGRNDRLTASQERAVSRARYGDD